MSTNIANAGHGLGMRVDASCIYLTLRPEISQMAMPHPILVIEDDPLALEALTDLLEVAGYGVIGASDGQEALQLIYTSDYTPFLILLDLGLPVIDGWEFLRRQKSDPKIAHIPVIVITAISSPQVPAADAILKKPVNVDQLFTLLAEYRYAT